jgi:hypothetical protein
MLFTDKPVELTNRLILLKSQEREFLKQEKMKFGNTAFDIRTDQRNQRGDDNTDIDFRCLSAAISP